MFAKNHKNLKILYKFIKIISKNRIFFLEVLIYDCYNYIRNKEESAGFPFLIPVLPNYEEEC